jgi:hypothetical protein
MRSKLAKAKITTSTRHYENARVHFAGETTIVLDRAGNELDRIDQAGVQAGHGRFTAGDWQIESQSGCKCGGTTITELPAS